MKRPRSSVVVNPVPQGIAPLPDELSQLAVHIELWRPGGRVVCIGVGPQDEELPVVLFVAVGDHWLTDTPD